MRRYFRLMIPVLMILSIYYACMKFDLFGKSTYNKIKGKGFGDLLWAAMLETWWGGWSFMAPTWTLGIEFWATFMIYLIALTGHNYKGRFFFYVSIIIFFFSMQYIGFLNLTYYKVNMFLYQLPYFFIGIVFSDMENMVDRPLDKIRNLHWSIKIPVNITLLFMFLVWGSSGSEYKTECLTGTDPRCPIYVWTSLDGFCHTDLPLLQLQSPLFSLHLPQTYSPGSLEHSLSSFSARFHTLCIWSTCCLSTG